MNKHLILAIYFLCSIFHVRANPIDGEQARDIASRFMSQVTGTSRVRMRPFQLADQQTNVKLSLTYRADDGTPCLYVINTEDNGGYVMVSGDDAIPLVVGYSLEGNFVEPEEGTAPYVCLQQMKRNIERIAQSGHSKREIKRVRYGDFPDKVEPMLDCIWDQEYPFSNFTPMIDTTHCVAGCVATAMAMVMKYHEWPKTGKGYLSYFDKGCNQTLSCDFSAHHYDWDNMIYRYDQGFKQKEADAVAQLMADCGIALRMNYGLVESGARPVYLAVGLHDYFDYDEAIQIYYRNFFTEREWKNLFKSELAAGRPILFSGWSMTLAHSFSCDGYDENDFFHFDWGMTGYTNGYYDLEIMTPDQPEWFHFKDNPEDGMNLLQMAVVGVQPARQGSQQYHVFALSWIKALKDEAARNESLTVETRNLCNIGWNINDGKTVLALLQGDEVKHVLYEYPHEFLLEEISDTVYTDTIELTIPRQVENGTYRLCPVFEDNGVWKEAWTTVGTPNYLFLHVNSQMVSLNYPDVSAARIRLPHFEFPDTLVLYDRPVYDLDFTNEGDDDFFSRFYVMLCREIENGKEERHIINRQGISLAPGETKHRHFDDVILTVKPGTYTLKIFHDMDIFIDSIMQLNEGWEKEVTVVRELPNGIDAVEMGNPSQQPAFDLSGRMVKSPNSNQLYIQDKKKYLKR